MGSALLICGATVLGGDGWQQCEIRIADGRVAEIGAALAREGAQALDAAGLRVAPGLVDLHLHGAADGMFEDGDAASARRILAVLPRLGTTALLATIGALPAEALRRAVEVAAAAMAWRDGARVLGIHLEGPFLNPARGGAQRPDALRAPSIEEIDDLQRRAGGAIRLVTLAPELPGALALIAALRRRGVYTSLGHSEASADVVDAAVAAGATHVTHLFNAMSGLHHRAPGLAAAGLTQDALFVELIADGAHVDRRMVDVVWRCKPAGRVLLISDGVAGLGEAGDRLQLFGAECVVSDAVRRVSDGCLVGGCAPLATAIRRIARWCPKVPPADIIRAASESPAQSLGLDAGRIAVGDVADLVLLDADLTLRRVSCRGRVLDPVGIAGMAK